MTLSRYEHTGAAPATGLASGITSSATSFTVLSGTGYPTGSVGDFVICLDPGTSSEEKILCSARSGTAFTVASSGRGYDGTTAASHSAGTTNVTHVLSAAEVDDTSDHIYTTTRDDHTQYARTDGTRVPVALCARMYLSANQSGDTSTDLITLDSQDFVGATGSPTVSTSSHDMTIVTAGKYLISAAMTTSYPSNQAGPQPVVYVYKNGSAIRQSYGTYMSNNPVGVGPTVTITDIVELAANDVLKLYGSAGNSSDNLAVEGGTYVTWLSAVLIGS